VKPAHEGPLGPSTGEKQSLPLPVLELHANDAPTHEETAAATRRRCLREIVTCAHGAKRNGRGSTTRASKADSLARPSVVEQRAMAFVPRASAIVACAIVASALAVSLTGCVYATKVKVEGREAFRIHCQNESQCVDKAGEVCASAYDVLRSSYTPDGSVDNGTGSVNSPIEMIIACKAAPPAGLPSRPPAVASVASVASSASTPSGARVVDADPAACAAAAASLKETAAFWGQLHPEAKRLDDLPSARDFGEVCRAMPERVQRCLDARYREAHDKPCLAVLKRLEPNERNKLDSLFLE
jgi:hypothetical protein